MGNFSYIARDSAGERVSGRLAGASQRAVLAELYARSLSPIEVREVRERRVLHRRVSSRRIASAYTQLSDLLRAGVPLLRALRLLGRSKSNPRLALVMNEIAAAVSEGERLAESMAARSGVFPPIHIAMIRAGEQGGFLEQVLARLGVFLEHQADQRSKIVHSLIYPLILLLMAGGVMIGALVFFVPKFESLFAKMELSWPTKLLLTASAIFTEYWFLLLIVGVGATIGGHWLWRLPGTPRRVAEWQLRIPKVSALIKAVACARFSRILGTMLANGIPMLTAMQISRDAAGHPVMAEAIDEATDAIRAGESLAKPLGESGMFGEDVVEMIAVGESANNLPEVLVTIADTIEKRVDRMLGLLIRLMEPALLLFLAGIVVFVFVALALPMMKLSTALSQ